MPSEQREGVSADRIEGDIAEIEKAGEANHDVEAEAEHHISENQDREVEQIAERDARVKVLLDDVEDDGKENREADQQISAIFLAVTAHRGDRPSRAPSWTRQFPIAVPPEEVEEKAAEEHAADHDGEQARTR